MTAPHPLTRSLAATLGDRLVTPEDREFAELAALVFAGDGVPALIARPVDAAEVAEVVRAAADTGTALAVRGGGHGYARFGVNDGGLVLDLRLLDGLHIDAERRVGTAGGGVTAGAYTTAAAEHGLATGFGDTPTVGIGGLVLGGGIGYLSRRDGLTLDNLIGAEVVLADGRVVRADRDEHADLFWAVRGGGGNFGVVTRLELRLTPTEAVTGGIIAFEPRPETVEALLAAAGAAPDEVSVMVNVMKAPPVPFLPADRHGTPIVVALVCHSGRHEDAQAALAPFQASGTVLADLVRTQPYAAMFRAEEPGSHASMHTGFGAGLDGDRAQSAIDLVRRAPSAVAVINLRPMGGAIARVPDDATAFGHRRQAVMESVAAIDLPAADPAPGRAWAAEAASLLGIGAGPGYVNFIGEPGHDAVHAAYPAPTLARLREVKRAYDPGNLFRSNVNIEPAGLPAAV